MNLEQLKQRNAANVLPVQLDETTVVHLRKLRAADGIAIGNALKASGHDDPNGAEPAQDEFLKLHVLVLSKTIVEQDEHGNWQLTLDSDEGREQLAQLGFEDAKLLSEKAQEWSGFGGEAKKN